MGFCASCGQATEDKPDQCPACAVSLVGPVDDLHPDLGRTVQHRIGRQAENGFIISIEGDMATIEAPSGRHEVATASLRHADPDTRSAQSPPLFRLYCALREMRADEEYGEPAVYRVWARTNALIGASLSRQRAFANAAVEAGDADAIQHAGLSPTETIWLEMHAHVVAGRFDMAIRAAVSLPPDRYPDRRDVVLRFLPQVLSGGHLESVRPILESTDDPLLRLLHDCLFEGSATDLVADLRHLSESKPPSDGPGGHHDHITERILATEAAHLAVALLDAVSENPEDLPGVAAQVADWLKYRDGESLTEPRVLATLHHRPDALTDSVLRSSIATGSLSMLDDLIEQGVLTVDGLEVLAVREPADRRYLRARLSPARLTDDEVEALEFHFESDRRRLWAGQPVPLPEPVGETEVSAPDYNDRVVLALLSRLVRGDLSAAADLVMADPPQFVNPARLQEFAAGVVAGDLPREILADPSTWSVYRQVMASDQSSATDGQFPDFEAWLRLHDAREALCDWRPAEASEAAIQVLQKSKSPVVRDEARALLACALFELRDDASAMAVLEEVEAVDHSATQLVNYGVVAVELDPVTASDKLARAAMAAPTPELRAATARRATALWGSLLADGAEGAPDSLIQALRQLVVEPTSAADHAEFMRWMSVLDTAWLAVRRNTAKSSFSDTDEHDYFVQKAQDFDAGLEILATYLHEEDPAEPLVRERDLMVSEVLAVLPAHGRRPEAVRLGLAILDARIPLLGPSVWELPALVVGEYLAWRSGDADFIPDPAVLAHLIGDHDNPIPLPTDEDGRQMISDAVSNFGRCTGSAIGRSTERIRGALNGIVAGLEQVDPAKVNRPKVRQLTNPMLDEIGGNLDTLRQVTPWVVDVGIKSGLRELERALTDLRDEIEEVRR